MGLYLFSTYTLTENVIQPVCSSWYLFLELARGWRSHKVEGKLR